MRRFTLVFTLKPEWRPTEEYQSVTTMLERSIWAETEEEARVKGQADFQHFEQYDVKVAEN